MTFAILKYVCRCWTIFNNADETIYREESNVAYDWIQTMNYDIVVCIQSLYKPNHGECIWSSLIERQYVLMCNTFFVKCMHAIFKILYLPVIPIIVLLYRFLFVYVVHVITFDLYKAKHKTNNTGYRFWLADVLFEIW